MSQHKKLHEIPTGGWRDKDEPPAITHFGKCRNCGCPEVPEAENHRGRSEMKQFKGGSGNCVAGFFEQPPNAEDEEAPPSIRHHGRAHQGPSIGSRT